MTMYLLIFLAGLAGSLHCVGMCGGFACAIGPDARGRSATLIRHLIYNTGRVTTYCFLGALFAYFGAQVINLWDDSPLGIVQRVLACVSGVLMVLIGLQFFGFFQRVSQTLTGVGGLAFTQALRNLVKDPNPLAPLAFGVFNGFLPCPLVYAFVAQATASGDPLSGAMVMAAFGLGTFPAMLCMGVIGLFVRPRVQTTNGRTYPVIFHNRSPVDALLHADWRVYTVRFAGAFIIVLGLITVARGILPLTGHAHLL